MGRSGEEGEGRPLLSSVEVVVLGVKTRKSLAGVRRLSASSLVWFSGHIYTTPLSLPSILPHSFSLSKLVFLNSQFFLKKILIFFLNILEFF